MLEKINSPSDLKKGDVIRILSKPDFWSSSLNENKPLSLDFPRELVIEEISLYGGDYSMTCGEYGWNLNYIVKAGCIRVNKSRMDLATESLYLLLNKTEL